MAKKAKSPKGKEQTADELRGWQRIAEFLGQPVNVVERWAKSGMPVSHRGRNVVASPDGLNKWLQRESVQPVRLATPEADLTSELKRSLSLARR